MSVGGQVIGSEQRVWLGDLELACWSVGAGPPLVVVHGGPGLGHRYMRPLDVWAEEFRLIYYDQRGSGESPATGDGPPTLAGAVEDLEQLRAALGLERVNLVGHSFGALLAVLYSVRQPDHTGSLVLLSPAPHFLPELAQRLSKAMAARRTAQDDEAREAIRASEAFRRRDPKAVERFILNVYLPFFSDRRVAKTLDMGFTEITAVAVLELEDRWFAELLSFDPMSSLNHVQSPTLVVYGDLDPTPIEFARLLVEAIAGAEFVLLSGAGHFAHVEDPQLIAKSVLPFLRKHAT